MEISVTEVGPLHFAQHPVWEFCDVPGAKEVMVRPVTALPVDDLNGRVIAVRASSRSGSNFWLALAGLALDPELSRLTRQVYVYNDSGQRLSVVGSMKAGISEIEAFIGSRIDDFFPVTYDLTGLIIGSDVIGIVERDDVCAGNRDSVETAKQAVLKAVKRLI